MTGDGRWNWGVGGVSRVSTPSQIHMHMLKGERSERRGGQKEGREEHGRCHHNKSKRWAINMSSNQSGYEPSTCDCEKYGYIHRSLNPFVISTLSYSDHLHVFTHPLPFHFGNYTLKALKNTIHPGTAFDFTWRETNTQLLFSFKDTDFGRLALASSKL